MISRVLMFPLTLRMLHSMRAMQDIQPQMQEIQKKYTDPRRRQEETMKLYREAGVNPLGCLGPQLIQFPIFIALYQVIRITVGTTPETVLDLSHRLYDYPLIQNAIPLSSRFLGMDLAAPSNYVVVVLVFASMWLQQRISTGRNGAAASSEQQQQMNSMMLWMMPAMFAWFTRLAPGGLGLYWAATNIIGIILQWIFVGPGDFTWGSLIPDPVRDRLGMRRASHTDHRRAAPRTALTQPAEGPRGAQTESRTTNAGSGDQRQDGGRGDRPGSQSTGPAPRPGRRRRNH
jgi:YidC/Oxa1 family membrane protein insertase